MRAGSAPATVALAAATTAASLLILVAGWLGPAAVLGGFVPERFAGLVLPPELLAVPAWLTPLSATLIHGGIGHLLLNLLMLVYCGGMVEQALGSRLMLLLYALAAYAAAAGQWLIDPSGPMIGASGAIAGLVGSYALFYGRGRARAVGPVPMRAVQVLWLFAAWTGLQLLIGLVGIGGMGRIAIGAHIGGFAAGLALAVPLLRWRWRDA
jgi:membrane associated rhomboid family serine protease